MLLFTPDVLEAFEWFDLTYQLRGGYGWVMWQRTSLPAPGGVGDQPAKLMETLTLIARESNALITTQRRRARGDGDRGKRRRG